MQRTSERIPPFPSRLSAFLLLLAVAILFPACGSEKETDQVALSNKLVPPGTYPSPQGTDTELGLAGYAKVFCSAIFVSGRDPEEAMKNSGFFFLPEEDRGHVRYFIDREKKTVELTLGDTLSRKAKYFGSQGCILLSNEDKIFFEPVPVETRLPNASTQPWPMGDALEYEGLPSEIDSTVLAEAVETAFSPPEALTAAFLVVYKGKIIAERYAPGINKDTQLESWSMGESLTATLVGLLIQKGYLNLDEPAPVPAWQKPGDPRAKIRIRDLMQMSSGLKFTSHHDPELAQYTEYLDHFYVYTGAVNVFEYSYDRPLQFPVGTEGRYRNCDPLTLGYIIQQTVQAKGKNYLTFPQEALFDKIGIRKQVMETDPYGNFLLTGYDYGTARNWARLAMLHLQDGVWEGERLLPKAWADFVSTPAPAWKEPIYGGLFWLNKTGEIPLPKDMYYMAGGGGQRTFIVPSRDLIIVRLGHFRGNEVGMKSLDLACEKLMKAF